MTLWWNEQSTKAGCVKWNEMAWHGCCVWASTLSQLRSLSSGARHGNSWRGVSRWHSSQALRGTGGSSLFAPCCSHLNLCWRTATRQKDEEHNRNLTVGHETNAAVVSAAHLEACGPRASHSCRCSAWWPWRLWRGDPAGWSGSRTWGCWSCSPTWRRSPFQLSRPTSASVPERACLN